MTILYAVDETADLEQVSCTAGLLAQRADVHVLIDAPDAAAEAAVRSRLDGLPRVRCSVVPPVSPTPLAHLAEHLLRALDAPSPPRFEAVVRWSERAIPTAPECDALLATERPDVLLMPPLPAPGTMRADLLHSARALGIPSLRHGDRSTATAEHIAAAVDRLAAGAPSRADVPRPGLPARLARPVLVRVAARLAAGPAGQRAREARLARVRHSREIAAAARRDRLAAAKASAAQERVRVHQRRVARRDAVRRGRAAQEAAADARRAAALVVSREQFVHIREWAARMRTLGGVELSAAEGRLEAEMAPLWTAGLDAIATLRHWSAAITGVRAEDYVDIKAANDEQRAFAYRLRREFYARQKELGRALMVSDADVLGGGFGWVRNDIRYNADTIRFMHAAGALNDGAILTGFRRPAARQVVWEIGGGWGGFAHYFKTLCPDVSYLITGLPDVLMVSATFLAAAFPGARCRFYEPGADLWADAGGADFLFAPECALDDVRPPRLDLTLDLGATPLMTPERMSAHVRRAFEWGSRFSYTMLPPGTLTGPAAAVQAEVERYFWPHPIPPRPVGHAAQLRGDGVPQYTHLAGWRRIRV